jgi:Plavaka transposase
MFVPVIAGSNKTTVSVATGHQEYHLVYMSLGNLTNIARRAHGNALLPVAFLPIPKSKSLIYNELIMNLNSIDS